MDEGEFTGRYLLNSKSLKMKGRRLKIIEKSQCSCSDDEDGEQKAEQDKNSTLVYVNEKETYELVGYRGFFGNANFFRLFRFFYKLAHIPEDA